MYIVINIIIIFLEPIFSGGATDMHAKHGVIRIRKNVGVPNFDGAH